MVRAPDRRDLEIRTLRDQAWSHAEQGRPARAASCLERLEQLDPDNAEWSRRLADCHRRGGAEGAEVAALGRAAGKYARAGFELKAIAMCKLVLARRPDDREMLQELARLHGKPAAPVAANDRAPPPPPPRRRATPAAKQPAEPSPAARPAGASPAPVSVPSPDAALDEARLGEVVTARATAGADSLGLMYELDIEEAISGTEPGLAMPLGQRLRRAPLFSDVDVATLERLIDQVQLASVPAGQRVFCQGDRADSLYVVAEGSLVATTGPGDVELARYGEGAAFGEMGLISNQARAATIRALEDSQLLRLTRRAVNELIASSPGFAHALLRMLRQRFVDNLLTTSELFVALDAEQRQAFVSHFKFLDVAAGTTLVAEGLRSPGLFILLGGRCLVIARKAGQERCLAELSGGDVFGEMSLLGGGAALASVTATSRSFLLRADARSFLEISMTHPTVLEHVSQLREKRAALNVEQLSELDHARLRLS